MMTPRCSFCESLAALPGATHVTYVWSRIEQVYVPCCIPCIKRRKEKLIRLLGRAELKLRG
jgi:hypothetical protein